MRKHRKSAGLGDYRPTCREIKERLERWQDWSWWLCRGPLSAGRTGRAVADVISSLSARRGGVSRTTAVCGVGSRPAAAAAVAARRTRLHGDY